MLDVFGSLKTLVKISRVHIDSNVFRLHYTFTVIVLFTFCIIVTTRQYVGDPINCTRNQGVPETIINTYCWIHTTYTIPSAYHKKVGIDVPHPGIDASQNPEKFRYHKYYQWVCFMLFFQATLFYVPRWLWKTWEGGKIQTLMMDLDIGLCAEADKKEKKKFLVNYLVHSSRQHDWYTAKYFFSELLAFLNVVFQMFLMDRFFDGEFLEYGLEVIRFAQLDQEERTDPMIFIFPRVTKCRFFKYGPSGKLELLDALCVMPLNIINEKIYIFIWFWFIILAVLTGLVLGFRVIIIASPSVRVYLLNMRFRIIHMEHLHTIISKGSVGDWFVIYLLGQNLDTIIFRDVVVDLSRRLTSQPKQLL